MSKPFRIFGYCRVSTEEQAENPEGSIKNQEQRLREYVRFRNQDGHFGEIHEVLIDAGISAKDMNRPALQKLLRKIASREVDLVMVTDLSRFTRSTKDFSNLWEFMQRNGCKFQSLRENFDSTTAAGEMIMFTLANFAQFERKQTGERISASFLARAKRGLYNGGSVPLGLAHIIDKPGVLQVVEQEAEIIRIVFKTFLREGTLSSTAKALNQMGLKIKREVPGGGGVRAGFFRTDTVHNILRNKAYIGVREFRDRGEIKETKASWAAIVDEITFSRAQTMLAQNKSSKKPHSQNRYPYLLSGICFCKSCGDRMSGKSAHGNGGKIGYYEHSWSTKACSVLSKKLLQCEPARIQAKLIEPVVWNEVKAFLLNPEIAKELIAQAQLSYDQGYSTQREIDKLKAKVSGLKYQTLALAERLSELPKNIDPTPLFDQMAKLQGLSESYERQIVDLKAHPTHNDEPMDFSDLVTFTKSLKTLLQKENDPVVKAHLIQKVVEKILVTPTGIDIYFYVGKDHFKREMTLAEVHNSSEATGGHLGSPRIDGSENLPTRTSRPLAKYRQKEGPSIVEQKTNHFVEEGKLPENVLNSMLGNCAANNLSDVGSNSLTNGGGGGN